MRDLIGKLTELEASAPKASTGKKMLTEDSTTPPVNKPLTLKDVFENMSQGIKQPIPVVGKQGDTQQTGAGFLSVTDNSPAGQAMQKALGDLAGQGKAQIVVPTNPQDVPAGAGAAGVRAVQQQQQQQGQQQVQETSHGEKTITTYFGNETGDYDVEVSYDFDDYGDVEITGVVNIDDGEDMYDVLSGADLDKLKTDVEMQLQADRDDEGDYRYELSRDKLDELSPKTLAKYIPAAAKDAERAGNDQVYYGHDQDFKRGQNRQKGIERAVKKLSTNEGAKVDRMVKHIEKSERKLGKSKEKASDIAWATANKRGMLDNKNKKKVKEGDIAPTNGIDTKGAGLGAGRSATTLEGKKPDFLDLDKDGNKKESMKKAAADKKKKKVDESMNHRISAARLEGKSHGLRGHAHSGKRYEDLEEMKAYHEGYKEGLDECYGQGVYETAMPATVPGMDSSALSSMPTMEDEIDEGIRDNLKKAGLAAALGATALGAGGMAKGAYDYHHKEIPGMSMSQGDFDKSIGHNPGAGRKSYFGKNTNEDEIDEGKLGKAALALGGAAALATGAGIGKNVYDYHKKDASGYSQADADKIMGIDSRRSAYDMDQRRRGNTFEDEFDEGNAFTGALANTPKGGKFSVGGKTYTDRTNYDAKVNEYAFESQEVDEAVFNPMGKVARELRGVKNIVKSTPHAQMPGAIGAGAGAAVGIPAAATAGAVGAAFLPIIGASVLGGYGLLKAGQLTGKVLNWLAQKFFGTKEEALEFAKAHLAAARAGETSFQHNGKNYKVSLKPGQVGQLMHDIDELSSQIKNKEFDKRMAPDTMMGKIGAALKEDPVFESWDRELQNLLNEGTEVNEGLSVSVSKGQENAPDSVTITAQDAEADQLLQLVKHAGLGLFGDEPSEPSSAMSVQPSMGEPDEVGAGGVDVEVVDGSDSMLSLMQKLGGVEASGPDYEEEGDEEQLHGNHEETCNECGGMMEAGHSCGSKMDEEETPDQEEFEVAEDNAPDSDEAETSADEDAEAEEDKALAGAASGDEEEIDEGLTFESIYKKFAMLAEADEKDDDDEYYDKDGKVDPKGAYDAGGHYHAERDADKADHERSKKKDKKIDEWANQVGEGPGKGTDAGFEQDIEFMTKVISGGLNKPKSTGQTTVPVIAGQEDRMRNPKEAVNESINDWVKLAGINKS